MNDCSISNNCDKNNNDIINDDNDDINNDNIYIHE